MTLTAGACVCAACGLAFEAAVLSPPEQPAPRQLELSQGQVQCARHARNAAVASCERCGAFMCALCRIDADGKSLCAACFERLRASGELESASTSSRSFRTLGLHLGILGLPFMAAGILIGPASVIATVRGMRQERKEGTAGETFGAVLALVLGAVSTLGGVLLLFAFAGAFGKK
jgi:uncharacterized paraquat-inducible protein A